MRESVALSLSNLQSKSALTCDTKFIKISRIKSQRNKPDSENIFH